jgi:hypothetical protein
MNLRSAFAICPPPSYTIFSQLFVVERRAGCETVCVKKYLLFTYYTGRSLGGAKDFLDSFDSVEEALDNILEEWTRYYQVVDRDTMQVVREGLARFKSFGPHDTFS